jgi:hypothetical protein
MKIWPINVNIPKLGICEVREHTDKECAIANKQNINYAPRSHGFVNLFQDDEFKSWCGVDYARKRLVDKKAILPKYIRDIPI